MIDSTYAAAARIEDLVRARLAIYPDLAHTDFDLGRADANSLHIWFDGHDYPSVDNIPDERVREAITQVVVGFNR